MATVPDPPRNKTQPLAGVNSLTFSWLPPLNDGGSPITAYEVNVYGDPGYQGLAYSTGTGPEGRQVTASGYQGNGDPWIANGVTYYCSMVAYNAIGQSAPAYFRPFQAGHLPDPPASATAVAVGSDKILVSWTPPSVLPDATIFWYVITVKTSGGTTVSRWTANGLSQSSYMVSNVAAGSYDVYVQAVNCPGYSSMVLAGSVSLPQGLLLWLQGSSWNNTTTWTDSSPNGKNAILATGTSAGNGGNSVVFDGSTYWTFPTLGSLATFTVTAWYYNTGVYPSGIGSPLPTIITEQFDGGQPYVNYALTFNQILGDSGQWSGGFFSGGWQLGTFFSITNSVWTYIAYTFDGNSIVTYINGALIGTVVTGAVTPNTSTLPGRIGTRWDALQYITGRIGELRVYNRALGAAEIANLYTTTQGNFP